MDSETGSRSTSAELKLLGLRVVHRHHCYYSLPRPSRDGIQKFTHARARTPVYPDLRVDYDQFRAVANYGYKMQLRRFPVHLVISFSVSLSEKLTI